MEVSTNKPATSAVKTYEPTKTESKTGSQTVAEAVAKHNQPTDKLEISDAAQEKQDHGNATDSVVGKGFADFDMDAFQGSIRSTLMQSINEAKKALMDAGVGFAKYNENSILYDLSELEKSGEVKAAEVPEYWNAENTSQRIVDFAMSFRGLAPELSDEEYIEQVRAAVEEGYRLAKKSIGDLPGPSAKLFNDTYSLTMSKFDEILAKLQKGSAE
ncbi:MAG: hypothetical protein FWC15_00780 [Fibromonadales bacterium]|nr:hypothetical protein [Fibromonadales bacterium]